jgi:hypothetical protein
LNPLINIAIPQANNKIETRNGKYPGPMALMDPRLYFIEFHAKIPETRQKKIPDRKFEFIEIGL